MLDYNEVFNFMKEFEIDLINRFGEFIIDEPTNTYVTIKNCKDIEEVKTYVVYAISRPICKGLQIKDANRILNKFNNYFNKNLTRKDFEIIYEKLCYVSKLDEFSKFIKNDFNFEQLQ